MRPWVLLTLISCGRSAYESEVVEQICAKVVSCSTYGWSDQSECEDAWIDNDDYGTECAYNNPYLTCAEDCLAYDCGDFADCESYCWVSYCL